MIRLEKNTRIEKKKMDVEMKGGKCQSCGYEKCLDALEFHHLDPSIKEFNLSRAKMSDGKRASELNKCILLCANCHRELHYEERMVAYQKKVEQKQLELAESRRKFCSCGAEFTRKYPSQTRCQQCVDATKRKVQDRPSKEELQVMIDTSSWVAIGEKYGVSDNAVRKWARAYDIAKSPEIKTKLRRTPTANTRQDGMKICHTCNRLLFLSDFYRSATNNDGRGTSCRGCMAIKQESKRATKED